MGRHAPVSRTPCRSADQRRLLFVLSCDPHLAWKIHCSYFHLNVMECESFLFKNLKYCHLITLMKAYIITIYYKSFICSNVKFSEDANLEFNPIQGEKKQIFNNFIKNRHFLDNFKHFSLFQDSLLNRFLNFNYD